MDWSWLVALLYLSTNLIAATVVNKKVHRLIDLGRSVARHTVTLELDCGGEDGFYVVVPETNATKIAKLTAQRTGSKKEADVIKVDTPTGIDAPKGGGAFWRVQFKKPQNEVSITVKIVEVGSIIPYPRTITSIHDPLLVEYYGSSYWFSPYETSEVTTQVKLGSQSKIEEYSKKNAKLEADGSTITYGPFEEVGPYKWKKFRVHMSSGVVFQRANFVHRSLQLSHWGDTVSVEEHYDLSNAATEFVGTYSRLDFDSRTPPTAITKFTANIPKASSDIYYRDTIGNISTSTVRQYSKHKLEVEMKPRYPLLGGWKANFYWGYIMPLSAVCEAVEGKSNIWELLIPRAQNIKDLWAEKLILDVRLPDGAQVQSVHIGSKQITETEYELTYEPANLYIQGRPTVTITSENVVTPDADEELRVVYHFGTTTMMLQPLYLGMIFGVVFLFSFMYVRLH